MRQYAYYNLYEMGNPRNFIDGKAHTRFGYQIGVKERTNPNLIANFMKVAKWIEENCPNLNGEFECRHNPYYKIILKVENGKAYLETGSHSPSFEFALSSTETAYYSQGSCQGSAYAFRNEFFFRNDRLEEFLSQWHTIKMSVISANRVQNKVYSEEFVA